MKAAIYKKYGPPSVISVVDVPKPSPRPNQILVKVHASTVNRTDTGYRSAVYFISRLFTGLTKPKKQVLGTEFAGEVAEVGSAVAGFVVGDRVYGFDEINFGGNAEYKVIEYDAMVAHIPADLSFAEAAPIAEGAHYALHYIRAARIDAGLSVFINGATGAIGSAAVQIIAAKGAEVTASCRPEHAQLVQKLGASTTIDYTSLDVVGTGKKYDIIFDAVGKSTYQLCSPALVNRGIYMSTEFGKPQTHPRPYTDKALPVHLQVFAASCSTLLFLE